jgi:tripartite-type tricarboxylate transporter receptor subunit TctC
MSNLIRPLLALLALLALTAQAQPYPSRPVTIIVPYAAGGSLDAVTRILAKSLTTRLGQPVLVENRAGAGSNIGAAYVAKSPADGYTLFLASPATAINVSLYSQLSYDPEKDLTPVSLITAVPSVLIVPASSSFKSVAELVAYAKQNPGKLNYSSGGAGSSEHLGSEMFKFYCGVDVTHIPYKGGAPAMTDLMAGQVSMMFSNRIGALPHIRSGKLRALGVADSARSPQLPEVPTFAEVGYPNLKVLVWSGIMAPAGTPPAVVNRLHAVITEAMQAPDMKAQMDEMGVTIASGGPAQFGEFLKREIALWRPIVKQSGARVD